MTGGLPRAGSEDVGTLLVDLADHLDALVAYWDHEQRCRFANQASKCWFGRGRQELLGVSLRELLGPLYALNLPHIEAAYRGEKQVFEREIPRPDGDGSCVRDYDTVARLGGDEFFLLVAGLPPDGGIVQLAQRIVEAGRRPFEVDAAVLRPGLSVGIAQYPLNGATKEALMLASDRALYAAKRAGGDCFRVADRSAPAPSGQAARYGDG